MTERDLRLSVVGLGKLGSPLVAVLASAGYAVTGIDTNPAFVEAINNGKAPVEEPDLQEWIDRSRGRIRATGDYAEAIAASDITFIVVPTPSGDNGRFSNRFVIESIVSIGKELRKKSSYHLVVVTSTVMPGSTGGEIAEALEASSGRKTGRDVGLCYNPEFIALGSVIRDMRRPDVVLIGESDPTAGQMLADIYARTTENQPSIQRMSFINAELTKIAINTFVTTKISYANMIADMCDRLTGADADVVCRAVGDDSRIGRKYLKGAVGYGGPCFPRDNKAFAALGRTLGAHCDLAEATDRINDYQLDRLQGFVADAAAPGATVAILGLAYKPGTGVIEAAQGVMLARLLAEAGYAVVVFDPLAGKAAEAALGGLVRLEATMSAAVAEADLVVVVTPWPEFAGLTADDFARDDRKRTLIDPWRIVGDDARRGAARVVVPGASGLGAKPVHGTDSLAE